ncbi:MAG TPA: hypothetical protein VK493_08560 [Bryobacteraceae bacterium]|nr:hypothetical protein [Bryobacteraceae bacterium]
MKKNLLAGALLLFSVAPSESKERTFQTSDRCLACHNGLTTASGQDISIGFAWRSSIMANSSRDPYWQASVRRESIDHPESQASIEDECSTCHMPISRFEAKLRGRTGKVFDHLPFDPDKTEGREAEDGVSCSVCHQIAKDRLGTRESFNGGFVIHAPESKDVHPEYGPFDIEKGNQTIMRTSTGGFRPTEDSHIRDSKLCATCHQLYTKALGPDGKIVGELPEQMPYLEWLHSDYRDKQTCQACHMPEVTEPTPISKVLGIAREGLHRHVFVAGNFFMQGMLNRYRDDLSVEALPQELKSAADATIAFLQEKSARLRVERSDLHAGRLQAEVFVENLSGHKLPTAYPSRRAWLHVVVRDGSQRIVFESGKLNPDGSGSIQGNDNDSDSTRFEPHYSEITSSDQVQIYESILKDPGGRVTTGLLSAVGYIKDNRLLPHGFDKRGADKDIAVYGAAADDPDFTDAGDRVRYSVEVGNAPGPFRIEAELWYQPIGYRWANNLKPYGAASEPKRFNEYYDSMSSSAGVIVVRAEATVR